MMPALIVSVGISIHTPPTRGDLREYLIREHDKISIHTPPTRGDEDMKLKREITCISIHTPPTRGDLTPYPFPPGQINFKPHPSYEG